MTSPSSTTDTAPDGHAHDTRSNGFLMGLLAGGIAGVGLGMLFAPRAVLDLRRQAADSAKSLGEAAADRCQEAGTRIGAAVDDLASKGQSVRDALSDGVVRRAQDVERFATALKSGH
jgi:gas vesicle protein